MTFDKNILLENENKDQLTDPVVNDEKGANLDNTLGDNDLPKVFDNICPITGDVFAALKDAAADPDNLKIAMVKEKDGVTESYQIYVEALEFATFCEAAGLTEGEAADVVIDHYKETIPELDNAEFHVVFPSDALNKNVLGGENLGLATDDDWAMQLMRGIRRYGLKANAGVEKPVTEASINEEVDLDKLAALKKNLNKTFDHMDDLIDEREKVADKYEELSKKAKED